MFKKLLLTTAILASSSVAFAGAPYVGASIGVNSTQLNVKDYSAASTLNLGGNNPNINVFGGYGSLVNQNIYVGGEGFVNTTTGTIDSYFGDASVKYKTRYSYGVSLIPGVMVSDHTLVYGRLGVVRSNFEVKQVNPVASSNDDDSVAGAQAGLGLQTSLTQNIDLRGEYVYTNYRSFTIDNVKTTPTSDQVNLGIVYKIG